VLWVLSLISHARRPAPHIQCCKVLT